MKTTQPLRSRKQFLVGGGAFLTAAALSRHIHAAPGRLSGSGDDPLENARASGLTAPILQTMNAGITAPNPHNTQAWKFLVHGPDSATLYVDETRLLPATDPLTRQIHIGQGTFLEHASIAATHLGLRLETKMFPQGYDRNSVGRKPVALMKLVPAAGLTPDPLYAAMATRATTRTEYDGPMITAAEWRKLNALVRPEYCELVFLNDSNAMQAYGDLFYRSLEIELSVKRFGEENTRWMRYGDDEIYGKRDGINLPGNGITGIKRWVVETFFDKALNDTAREQAMKSIDAGIKSAKGIVYMKTKRNTLREQTLVGRDYARLQLALEAMGMVLQPYSPLVQETPEIAPLEKKLNRLAGVGGSEKIQMIVRIGRSDYKFLAPRRPLPDMITKKV